MKSALTFLIVLIIIIIIIIIYGNFIFLRKRVLTLTHYFNVYLCKSESFLKI